MSGYQVVPLASSELAQVAPNWHAMQTAIAQCESVDEIRSIADKALAISAYFALSQDIDNENRAMRVRIRAERRMGELIVAGQKAGTIAKADGGNRNLASTVTRLSYIGIPYDRSARAQALARVSDDQFEAALNTGNPSLRSCTALAPPKYMHEARSQAAAKIDVRPVLKTWGTIREFAAAIGDGSLLPSEEWTKHPGIQLFQIAEIRAALPVIAGYIEQLSKE